MTLVLSFSPDYIEDGAELHYFDQADLFTDRAKEQLSKHHFDKVVLNQQEPHLGVAVFFYVLRFLKDEARIVWASNSGPIWIDQLLGENVMSNVIFQKMHGEIIYHRPNMCLMTMILGEAYKAKVELGTASKKDYAEATGMKLEAVEEMPPGLNLEGRPMSWARILLFKHYLEKYEYIFYVDGDTILLNDTFAPEMMLVLMQEQHKMLVCQDQNGQNLGVMLIKRSPELIALLDRMWACTYCINHMWWENKAFIDLYAKHEDVRKIVRVIPKPYTPIINAYVNNYKSGWLIHFAGIRNDLPGHMNRHYRDKRQKMKYNTCLSETYWQLFASLHL